MWGTQWEAGHGGGSGAHGRGQTQMVRRRWRRGCGRSLLCPAARPLPSLSWEDHHPTLNWQGPRVGAQDTGHPELPPKAGPQHQSPARRTFLQKGRVGAELGGGPRPCWWPGALGHRPRDRFLPLLVHVLSAGWRPTAVPQSWTQRWSAARTSSWWAPASCRRPRRQSPAEVRVRQAQTRHSGCQPPRGSSEGSRLLEHSYIVQIPGQGQEGPTQTWTRNMPGKAEGAGCRRPRLLWPQKINVWHLFLAAFKLHISRRKGPLLNFLSQILLHTKSRLTSET